MTSMTSARSSARRSVARPTRRMPAVHRTWSIPNSRAIGCTCIRVADVAITTVWPMPVAIPVSLRTDADPMGANKFAGARFVAPVGEPDPKARIAAIHDFVVEARMNSPPSW